MRYLLSLRMVKNTRIKLGVTSNDKARNRIKILQEDFELGKDALAQERAGVELTNLQGPKSFFS